MVNATENFIKPVQKLLTQEEEIDLFKRWHAARDSGNEREAEKLLSQIVKHFTPLVVRRVRNMSGYKLPKQELTGEALLALVSAAQKFDPEMGFRFSTFAQSYIRGMLFVYVKKNYFITNVCTNRHVKRLFFSIRSAISDELQKTQSQTLDDKSIRKIAEGFDIPEEDVVMFANMFANPYESLNVPVAQHGDDNDTDRQDWLESQEDSQEEVVMKTHNTEFYKKLVRKAMEKLSDRERIIFEAQTLRDRDDADTLSVLGDRFNLSKERIRQIRVRAEQIVERDVRRQIHEQGISVTDLFA